AMSCPPLVRDDVQSRGQSPRGGLAVPGVTLKIPSRATRDTAATWYPGGRPACACKTNLLGWATFFFRAERVHLGGFGEYVNEEHSHHALVIMSSGPTSNSRR